MCFCTTRLQDSSESPASCLSFLKVRLGVKGGGGETAQLTPRCPSNYDYLFMKVNLVFYDCPVVSLVTVKRPATRLEMHCSSSVLTYSSCSYFKIIFVTNSESSIQFQALMVTVWYFGKKVSNKYFRILFPLWIFKLQPMNIIFSY